MALIPILLLAFIVLFGPDSSSASLPHFPTSLLNSPNIMNFSQGPHEYDRIVGGVPAEQGEFPFQISIQRYSGRGGEKSSHFCGGSIVSPRVIVSAGHCAKNQEASKVRICVGALNIKTDCTEENLLEVSAIKIHQHYQPSTIDNDISTFILESPLRFNERVAPVRLPTDVTEVKENTACFVSGWGTTSEGGGISHELLYVEVPTVATDKCKESYGVDEITASMICAGEEAGGKDSCQGDSGGPMIAKDTKVFTGITSWGYGCARPGYPGVYTNVQRFVDWIHDVIGEYR